MLAVNFFFAVTLHFFGSISAVSRFGERFQYSLVNFLFAALLSSPSPRAPPFVKLGARPPPVPHGVGATDCIF